MAKNYFSSIYFKSMNRHLFRIQIIIILLCFFVLRPAAQAQDDPKNPSKCAAPAYLKAGDKVALITPSYYGSMENTRKAAKVLRSWGFKPVIGPNVGSPRLYIRGLRMLHGFLRLGKKKHQVHPEQVLYR